MLVENLIRAEWRQKYFIDMRASQEPDGEEAEYTETDFDNFVEITFRQCAEELGVKYSLIKDVLYGRNIAFFELKARIFADYESISPDSDEYSLLTSKLFIPDVSNVNRLSTITPFINYFKELELKDQIAILSQLKKAKLDVSVSSEVAEVNEFLGHFNELEQSEKCEIVRGILGIEVNLLG